MSVRRRGATMLEYGAVVGLIAVIAISAITLVGGNTSRLFGSVSNRLINVTGDTGGSGGTGGSGNTAPFQCANNTAPLAKLMRGASPYYLCRGLRSFALPANAATDCPPVGSYSPTDRFTSVDGSVVYGGLRYEANNVTSGSTTTNTGYSNSNCTNAACTTGSGSGGTATNTNNYVLGVNLCSVGFDAFNATGQSHSNGFTGGVGVDRRNHISIGGGAGSAMSLNSNLIGYHFLRAHNAATTTAIADASTQKVWLELGY